MFLPLSILIAILVLWVAGGALLGALLGHVSAGLLRLDRRRPWLDALAGSVGALLLIGLIGAIARGTTTQIGDHTLGRRGIVLDHVVLWGVSMISLAVLARQLFSVLARRRAGLRAAIQH